MKLTSTHYVIILVVIIFGSLIAFRVYDAQKPGVYDDFAQCVADTDTIFYGAFWCPHCKEQKEKFGNSAALLPYTECSLASGNGQTQECIDADIKTYPTWEFPGGERVIGTQELSVIAEKTGCELPTDTL
ncbi:hypothetical protein GW943_01310 [Candidatus Parcubacteria bacterium]|uniref:Thioredoxin domain-containing protein n=1 Tax=Candidatus Kaiserbacteria bacterium CG10_big_fil_rev_8_21_14_0_10_47_16 TaxID=1974608 RepID=A0A2H0UDG3_9BACT|nr:hypothetical protein [Candidatus Parcubacteria bacterium]PIR84463.1 MAG: hypothetical protein COU16_02690 [Candidatus Kaiserbacteria bacterium CG10_big_fil_rev_8_21_14_0_10_47_16]